MKTYFYLLTALSLVTTNCSPSKTETKTAFKNHEKPINTLVTTDDAIEILIDKSDYKLSLISEGKVIKEYPVVFGTNPVDDKRMEGDRCTPEGKFKVHDLYPHHSWSKFIWIDYPTPDSWNKFNASKEAGELPEGATIGGEIGIHGVPEGKDALIDNKNNWTWGCISMKTASINEVYSVTKKGTSVTIRP